MKHAFIQTFGCQMNEHDTQRISEILTRIGYVMVDQLESADLILMNTCSVRENPENKVYSLLGRLSRLKKKRPNLIIGVAGCVAQQEGERILKREKSVDLVFGPDNIFSLPDMLAEVADGKRALRTGWLPREKKVQNFIPDDALENEESYGCKAYIAITKGCDNFCAFCIVPTTRGRLVSRDKANIIDEAKLLIQKGVREIQLLGQNVNSYQAGDDGFYELLDEMSTLPGLVRLRFTSPHPNDWTNQLTDLMASRPVICDQIHLPFQAGANRILKAMRRGHIIEDYLKKIEYLKSKIPNISISTDIIVGFPGETDEEFEQTLNVVKRVRFSQAYSFMYSDRPGTKAEKMSDQVPKEIREERLQRLLAIQNPIQSELIDEYIDSVQSILIDSAHPKERGVMTGRTQGGTPVSIENTELDIGDLVNVKITGRKKHSLIGIISPNP